MSMLNALQTLEDRLSGTKLAPAQPLFLYFGIVVVTLGLREQVYNECFVDLHPNEDTALGSFVRRAREMHPGSNMQDASVYRVPDQTVLDAARYLSPSPMPKSS